MSDRLRLSSLLEAEGVPAGRARQIAARVAVIKRKRRRRMLKPINRNRAAVKSARDAFAKHIKGVFDAERPKIAAQIHQLVRRTGKADSDRVDQIMGELDFDGWVTLVIDGQQIMVHIVVDGSREAVIQVDGNYTPAMLEQVNKLAVDWASDRAAEMVGMKYAADGTLIENPNAEYAITDSTRELLRSDIAAAIDEGLSTDELADRLSESYAFSDERAETIARTEIADADVQGSLMGYKESGLVDGKELILSDSHSDPDECDDAAAMGAVPLDDDFGGLGDPPYHPNCVLGDTVVSAAGVAAHYRRWFEGEVVVVTVAREQLTLTLNHPVLTDRGWLAAGALKVGDDVFECVDPVVAVNLLDPDDHHIETPIEQIAGALRMSLGVSSGTMPSTAEYFHGDGLTDGEIDVVASASALERIAEANLRKNIRDLFLGRRHFQAQPFAGARAPDLLVDRNDSAFDGDVSGRGSALALRGADAGSFDRAGIASGSNSEAVSLECVAEGGAVAPVAPSEIDGRLAGLVRRVKVTEIRKIQLASHVYNLTTAAGWYIANRLMVKNCECDVLPVLSEDS